MDTLHRPEVSPAVSIARPVTMAACAAIETTGSSETPHCCITPPSVLSSPLYVSTSLRSDSLAYRGTPDRNLHGSMPRLDHPLSTHSSLHKIDSHSRHSSQRDTSEVSPTLITHGTTGSDGRPAEDGTSA